jgi:hypothetical protein
MYRRGSYSSGYCPGLSPDSLFIPVTPKGNGAGNLNTLILVQRYIIIPNATRENMFFIRNRKMAA